MNLNKSEYQKKYHREKYHNDVEFRRKHDATQKRFQQSEKGRNYYKDYALRTRFGISLTEFNKMFSEQKGECKICGLHQRDSARTLVVDHCHDTGRVRSLLCHKCNSALGLFGDSVSTIKTAIKYLQGDL